MSFLNRLMASVGIGGARVDTQWEDTRVRAGDELCGIVRVEGGSEPQQISQIYLHLVTQFRRGSNDRETLVVDRFKVGEPFRVEAGEVRAFPFRHRLPVDLPAASAWTKVWLKTGLDVPLAVDPSDKDTLTVLPHRHVQVILDALSLMGFHLRRVECAHSRLTGRRLQYIQEYDFVPRGLFWGRLDQLEAVFFPRESGLDLFLEVDRRARGVFGLLEEALELDERCLKLAFTAEQLAVGPEGMAHYLAEIIGRHAP